MTRSLAVEFAAQKVRVNAIAPSATMTDRVRKLIAGNAAIDKLAKSHLLGLIEPTTSPTWRCSWPPTSRGWSPDRCTGGQRRNDLLKGQVPEGGMKIKRVEHIAIAVNSPEAVDGTVARHVRHRRGIRGTDRPDAACHAAGGRDLSGAAGRPGSGNRRHAKWIKEKGTGLFHICFEVEDIDGALAELKAKGVKLRERRRGSGMAARGSRSSIRVDRQLLIELAELPSGHSGAELR